MTPGLLLAVAAAGGGGAVARLLVDGISRERRGADFPHGTMIINLTGSLALGLVTGLVAAAVLPPSVRTVVGTGFLGGYTTFSAAAVETVRLLGDRRRGAAAAHGLGMLVAGVALAAAGFALGSLAD